MIRKGYLLLLTGLLFLLGNSVAGCTVDTEREEIITFTQQALEIEAKRSQLNTFFGSLWEGSSHQVWPTSVYYLPGVPQGFDKRNNTPRTDLEGMVSLRNRLLLLGCPQSTQSIKDALDQIYNSEINLAELEFQQGQEYLYFLRYFSQRLVLPEVNIYNIEPWQARVGPTFLNHPLVKLQLLRRDTYTRWAEILREHGIDPAQEGFTELVGRG